jgi:hypothetical protein
VILTAEQKNETRPLVFHTLPADTLPPDPSHPDVTKSEPMKDPRRDRMCTATSLVPKLVSVVEIIKREYLKTLDMTLAERGTLEGLHQYNELSSIALPYEEAVLEDIEAERARTITLAVSGKN